MVVIPNRVRVVVMVSALALAAGLLTLALLAKPTQAQAETITSTERLPLNNTYFNPCTGEEFHIEGTVHLVQHRTIDENGTDHLQVHSNTQGRGESLTTGAQYVLHDATSTVSNFSGDSATNNYFSAVVKFIRQGSTTPEDDWEFDISFHFTINANGEITTLVEKGEFRCQ